MTPDLAARIGALFEHRHDLSVLEGARGDITEAIDLLDRGEARVAEVGEDGSVVVNAWLRQAILLYFLVSKVSAGELGPMEFADKVPLKSGFLGAGVRVVPGASARFGSFVDKGVVMMPSYVNIGARVGAETMIDTWATVGSCAQIGERVHLSGGVGIGGVLEPANAVPVVVEDDAFIGSRSMITQGARVGAGAVLGEAVVLNPTIPVIDAGSGEELSRGFVPSWCVAVAAQRRRVFRGGEFFLPCVLVLRHLAPGERHDKAILNEALRDQGGGGAGAPA
ncbi:MAG: 2,3,4,5-tetrahydropyridine-2,6-dicarboxylate N-succinyltransferase [Acidimicrobiales bacterium]